MNTTKITTLLIIMFVIAISAGIVAGRLSARTAAPPIEASTSGTRNSPLADALQLTSQQANEMRPVWEEARDTVRDCTKEVDRIQKENESQLNALLTEEQKSRYAQISQEHHDKIVAEETKRKDAFRQAVERTKKILTEDQWRAYEQILRNQVGNVPGATDSVSLSD